MTPLCAIHLRDDERVPATLLSDGQPLCDDCDRLIGGGGVPLVATGNDDDQAGPEADLDALNKSIGRDTFGWLCDPKRPYAHELTPTTVPPYVWRDIRAMPPRLKPGAIAEALRLSYNTVYRIRHCQGNRLPKPVQAFLDGKPHPAPEPGLESPAVADTRPPAVAPEPEPPAVAETPEPAPQAEPDPAPDPESGSGPAAESAAEPSPPPEQGPAALTLSLTLTQPQADRLWATLPFDEKADVIRWVLARRWEAL